MNDFIDEYLRQGREAKVEMNEHGAKAPTRFEGILRRKLMETSGIRKISTVFDAPNAVASFAVKQDPQSPDLPITLSTGDLYANPAASQAMLEDTAFDLEEWLASEIASEFARNEYQAFTVGDGVDRPDGFLKSKISAKSDGDRDPKSIQFTKVRDGKVKDALIDMIHTLKPDLRRGAVFQFNSQTAADLRKLKTADGAFLWQAGLVEGQPDRLLGYPVSINEMMPDIAPGAVPIAFGDFVKGYAIADGSTTILRDPFTNKPFVQFYATKRVGGGVSNFDAIKFLQF